ncbi:S9 family peptidase [Dactylosporangium vinaceum]|uniref:S9 family peptidase n=1 Tax=Dactylosporangium vinaceum TaxID=53362 RepID=A0ABV5MNE3_9ACTN|nr:S9 family peptidase [Dactylosporangium vinaceum]UAB95085.1 S9 family peptidase [Dactylosporangium vinaceum]
MKPVDLPQMRTPGAPALSPDGATAVVAVTRPDLDTDAYTAQLWLVPTDGSRPPTQLTRGWHDSAPRFSPDGRWLAFLRRDDPKAKAQLFVLPMAGGEARKLTDEPLGVGAPDWAPDSSALAFSARVPHESRYGTDPDAEPARRLTELFNRVDGLGFRRDRPAQLFTVTLDGDVARVTDGPDDHGDPRYSPDGTWLTFTAPPSADGTAVDVCVIRPDGSERRTLTDGTLAAVLPRFTPDGDAVVFAAAPAGVVLRNETLWSVPLAGGPARPLLPPADFHLAMLTGDLDVHPDGVLFMNEQRGAVQLLQVPFDGSAPTVLVDGPRQVVGFAQAAGVLVTTVATPADWGEVYAGERRLTAFSRDFPALEQVELTAAAPDGYPVHGWIVRPATEGPHPVLLMIHGGPYAQYGWRLFDEAQVYAGGGYAVVYGNPRGSSGYGEAHGEPIRGNVGEVSATDLLALLDAALKEPGLDASRVGVLGGSHGGFMTTWLAAHHGHRFRAAVSERAVNAIDSFSGSSDIGWYFADSLYTGDFAAQSPLTYADRIDIPMLIIHSEQDWRCPVEQAYRLFVALKRRNAAPVELLLFPGEGHELSRTGRPSHRVQRFDAILDWFGRHL